MKDLPVSKKVKQIIKGIWDSPCIEVCTYKKGDSYCKACGLTRIEKKTWKYFSIEDKEKIKIISTHRMNESAQIENEFMVETLFTKIF
ncbi:MAG: DUF1289 domain-containing protein [Leptospiraceae bacterium]|nr:DUF1289 domain-containing protein [Leptospiraceae bacterium]